MLLNALNFAAERHRTHFRKGRSGPPYINHLIEVAHLLRLNGVEDEEVLAAAVLHDSVEDVGVSYEELRVRFGERVMELVALVSDDMEMPTWRRKLHQIEAASGLPAAAQNIKVADKISNLRGIVTSPPEYWSQERKVAYYHWAREVVSECDAASEGLRRLFDEVYESGLKTLGVSNVAVS